MPEVLTFVLLLFAPTGVLQSAAPGELPSDGYLTPELHVGDSFTNVFSRTIAVMSKDLRFVGC